MQQAAAGSSRSSKFDGSSIPEWCRLPGAIIENYKIQYIFNVESKCGDGNAETFTAEIGSTVAADEPTFPEKPCNAI
jgi:hypothetical protein